MSALVIDTSGFTVHNNGRAAPIYWGMWGLMVIETIVVSSLIASYFYLRLMAVEWPPAGVKLPSLTLPAINTGLLVASGRLVHRADTAIRKGDQRTLKRGLLGALVLAAAFLVIKFIELSGSGYRWDSHVYGSIVFALSGFHTAHVMVLVLKTLVMLILALRGYFTAERNIGVQVNGLYWNFVVIIWVPIAVVLYFAPRLLE